MSTHDKRPDATTSSSSDSVQPRREDATDSARDVRDLPEREPEATTDVKGGARTAPAPDWYPF